MTKQKKSSSQEQYENFIILILEEKKCLSGADLSNILIQEFELRADYARQVIKRAVTNGKIRSSDPLTFEKGQFAYILSNSRLDKDQVKVIAKKYRKPLYRLLELIDQNHGIISVLEARKVAAAPVDSTSSKVNTLDDLLNLISSLNLVYLTKDGDGNEFILSTRYDQKLDSKAEKLLISRHVGNLTIDCAIIPDILRWLSVCNIINTSTSPIYRNKKTPAQAVVFNHLVWDAFSFTGFGRYSFESEGDTSSQSIVVLDVVLANAYLDFHLEGFYDRIQILRNSVKYKKRKILPIVIFHTCSKKVASRMKALGFLAFDVNYIFGSKVMDVLLET